jgi:molybdopterin-guanine dinucleotide biosynthesis protein
MMLIVGALSMTGTASATLIESIAALDDGDKYRVSFVTSTKRDATSSDITDYNTFVNTAAQAGSVTSQGNRIKIFATPLTDNHCPSLPFVA